MSQRGLFSDSSFWGSIGRRIKRRRDVIVTEDGKELEFLMEEESEFDPEGDFCTTQTVHSMVLPDGWKVSSPRHVVAICYLCQNFLSFRAVRYCRCGRVMCASCAEFWEDADERRYVCQDCHKSLRRKRFFRLVGRILVSPFVERRES